jgi:hypothetical protein
MSILQETVYSDTGSDEYDDLPLHQPDVHNIDAAAIVAEAIANYRGQFSRAEEETHPLKTAIHGAAKVHHHKRAHSAQAHF